MPDQQPAKPRRRTAETGLPAAPEAERVVLGSIVIDDKNLAPIAQILRPEDFAERRNQTIFQRMLDLQVRGDRIDRITLANELTKHPGEFESVGSLTYLVSLDEGLPQIPNPGSYASIVREKARLRAYVYASRTVATLAMRGEAPAAEVYREAQIEFGKIGDGTTGSQVESVQEFIESYPGGVSTFLDPKKWKPGVPTGFSILDKWSGGFHECEIFLLGARPGAGKTAMCMRIAQNIAQKGFTPVVFSMEMSKDMLLQRLICQEAGVSVERFRSGELFEDERKRVTEATGFITGLPIYFDETSGLTVPEMRVRLQAIMNERPVSLWIVDYAQLIRPSNKKYQNENEMFTTIANELQEMVKTTRVPLLLLSQLNRESEKAGGNQRPKLSQCRGAGAWEQIANLGALIYREWIYKRDRDDLRNVAELIVDKNRSGPSGTIKMRFTPFLMKFEDSDSERGGE